MAQIDAKWWSMCFFFIFNTAALFFSTKVCTLSNICKTQGFLYQHQQDEKLGAVIVFSCDNIILNFTEVFFVIQLYYFWLWEFEDVPFRLRCMTCSGDIEIERGRGGTPKKVDIELPTPNLRVTSKAPARSLYLTVLRPV